MYTRLLCDYIKAYELRVDISTDCTNSFSSLMFFLSPSFFKIFVYDFPCKTFEIFPTRTWDEQANYFFIYLFCYLFYFVTPQFVFGEIAIQNLYLLDIYINFLNEFPKLL